jgi:diadenosine tetraphosphatase ApaH/serine/threonine PP2A family protein phosphatase
VEKPEENAQNYLDPLRHVLLRVAIRTRHGRGRHHRHQCLKWLDETPPIEHWWPGDLGISRDRLAAIEAEAMTLTLSDCNRLALAVERAHQEFDRLATVVEDNTGENPAGSIDRKLAAQLRQAAVVLRQRQARMMKLYAEIQPEEIPAEIAAAGGMTVLEATREANRIIKDRGPKPDDSGPAENTAAAQP